MGTASRSLNVPAAPLLLGRVPQASQPTDTSRLSRYSHHDSRKPQCPSHHPCRTRAIRPHARLHQRESQEESHSALDRRFRRVRDVALHLYDGRGELAFPGSMLELRSWVDEAGALSQVLHALPGVKTLNPVFIGPELEEYAGGRIALKICSKCANDQGRWLIQTKSA